MSKIQLVDHLEREGDYEESRDGGRMSGAILMMSTLRRTSESQSKGHVPCRNKARSEEGDYSRNSNRTRDQASCVPV